MLTLALTMTLSSIHLPPPSSLQLTEAQVETRGRSLEIEQELASLPTTWPTGSVVLMAMGFGGTGAFTLAGVVSGLVLGGLPGVLILIAGTIAGGLHLLLGISGLVWGAASAGATRNRARKLEEERDLLPQAHDRPHLVRTPLIALATF